MKKNTINNTPFELAGLTPLVTLVTEVVRLARTVTTQQDVSGTTRGFDATNLESRLTHLADELSIRENRIDELSTAVIDMHRKLDMVVQFVVTPQEAKLLTKRAPKGIKLATPVKVPGRLVNAVHNVTTKTIIHPESAKLYRKTKQYSQAEMANDLNVSVPTIGNWESGHTRIRPGFRGAANLLHGKMIEVNHQIKYITNKEFTRKYPKKRNTRK
jgi:DNA-binding XRE family transcriptional regulator